MRLVIQLVNEAAVTYEGKQYTIAQGAVIYVGFTPSDNNQTIKKAVDFILRRRIVPDQKGKINLSLSDANRELMIIPNFTLGAVFTQGQQRVSFANAMNREDASKLFSTLVRELSSVYPHKVVSGGFGKMMTINQQLEGPYTYVLDI